MDSCFPSRYKLHDKKRRWELWGPSHPLTTRSVLPWISACLCFPTLRLGFQATWASAQTCAATRRESPSSVLSLGRGAQGGPPASIPRWPAQGSVCLFQACTGVSRSSHGPMWFVKQGLCLLEPTEPGKEGPLRQKEQEEKRREEKSFFSQM